MQNSFKTEFEIFWSAFSRPVYREEIIDPRILHHP